MKNLNQKIIQYTTTITDTLYYLLPLELFLSLLWSFSWGSIWIIDQAISVSSWDLLMNVRNIFQTSQSVLSQIIVVVLTIYLLAHFTLFLIWIKEDKFLNFFRTVSQLRKIRKQMQNQTSNEISREYESIICSIRCFITYKYICIIIPSAESSETDTILQDKVSFLYNYLSKKYRKLYVFSVPDDSSFNIVIHGERITDD
ncbi:hypothetical protein [Streptococcus suis]|uniref:hypothetical protein n=1 Tax=Streptococcus suis TaxID=1307 RepID=UPI0037D3EA66